MLCFEGSGLDVILTIIFDVPALSRQFLSLQPFLSSNINYGHINAESLVRKAEPGHYCRDTKHKCCNIRIISTHKIRTPRI